LSFLPDFYRLQKKVERFMVSDGQSADSILFRGEPSGGEL
jgi:hypothetical protein